MQNLPLSFLAQHASHHCWQVLLNRVGFLFNQRVEQAVHELAFLGPGLLKVRKHALELVQLGSLFIFLLVVFVCCGFEVGLEVFFGKFGHILLWHVFGLPVCLFVLGLGLGQVGLRRGGGLLRAATPS